MAEYPGETVDQVGRSITGAAKSLVSSVAGGLSGAGESVQDAADAPAKAIGLRGSPLRIVDPPLKGAVQAVRGLVNDGIIGGLEDIGSGITAGLDEVPKTLLRPIGGDFPKLPAIPNLLGQRR